MWEALLRHTVKRQAFLSPEVAINLRLKTENARYMGWLQSILERGQGRGTVPGTKVDFGKEQNANQSGPSEVYEKMGGLQEAWEVHISIVKSLHFIGVMGNNS